MRFLKVRSRLWKLSLILISVALSVLLLWPCAAPAQTRSHDFEGHVAGLRQRLPGPDFTIVVAPPFVVIGDEDPETVRLHSRQVVEWAVRKLKDFYFQEDPKQIIDIWLFKDAESYQTNTARLWGQPPATPYGYYSSRHRALIMNISTGGGTLVHELVHPFMEANFPNCPDWFNEGLASLYEQCREGDGGRIEGTTNWRLEGLQKAITRGGLQSIEKLTSCDFYHEDDGTNYAMARYLCYYLQQEGKLQGFYRELKEYSESDPTGYKTLQRTLGNPDMKAFQKDWEKTVLSYRL